MIRCWRIPAVEFIWRLDLVLFRGAQFQPMGMWRMSPSSRLTAAVAVGSCRRVGSYPNQVVHSSVRRWICHPTRNAVSRRSSAPRAICRRWSGPAFLDQACGGDAELRRQADSLLAAQRGRPVPSADQCLPPRIRPWKSPASGLALQAAGADRRGRLRRGVYGRAGRAGATQGRPEDHQGRHGHQEVIARFEAERQALALMDHPEHRPRARWRRHRNRPALTSSWNWSAGIPITDYCDQNQLSTAERLQLFMQVCHAVQHAHQKGIIHRDLKPSNVLVTLTGRQAGAQGD